MDVMKRFLFTIIILAGLGYVGWRVYQKATQEEGNQSRGGPRAVPVEVGPVTREKIRDIAEFTGTLAPKSYFLVAPKVPGRLERLLVNIGDKVNKGDLVAILDSDEYEQSVAQATAELEVSRANLAETSSALEIAERDYSRARELLEQKVMSESNMEAAEARFRAAQAKHEVAKAQIRQKEAALKSAEVRLSYTRIHAMWENSDQERVIAERFADEGTMLRANDPIVSVVDLSTVTGVIHVIERDYLRIQPGQPAIVTTDACEGTTFTGHIVRRAPILKQESQQARVEIEIPNTEELLAPGMFIRAYIQFTEHENAVIVPITALARRNGDQGVFLADPDQSLAHFRPVTTGIINGGRVEILSPEISGLVVTMGHHLLEDGSQIMLPEQQTSRRKPAVVSGENKAR